MSADALAGPFRPRPPWLTGDLQTLRNFLRRDAPCPGPFARLWLGLPDGDALAAAWHAGDQARPTVVLVHGLTGCEDSQYMRRSAAFWQARGHGVVRLNLRGSTPSLARSTRPSNAAAGTDIVHALAALPRDVLRPGLICIGVSLGGSQLLDALGREGSATLPILAAATICAPVLLAAAACRIMRPRNTLYHRWLLGQMQREAEALAPHLPPALLAAALAARSVYEFDDRYVAPFGGFAGAADYYAHASLPNHLPRIATPTLCLTSADDPWIPEASYRAIDWHANRRLTPMIASGGGHVGFHDRDRDGTWADRTIAAWVRRVSDAGASAAAQS